MGKCDIVNFLKLQMAEFISKRHAEQYFSEHLKSLRATIVWSSKCSHGKKSELVKSLLFDFKLRTESPKLHKDE